MRLTRGEPQRALSLSAVTGTGRRRHPPPSGKRRQSDFPAIARNDKGGAPCSQRTLMRAYPCWSFTISDSFLAGASWSDANLRRVSGTLGFERVGVAPLFRIKLEMVSWVMPNFRLAAEIPPRPFVKITCSTWLRTFTLSAAVLPPTLPIGAGDTGVRKAIP